MKKIIGILIFCFLFIGLVAYVHLIVDSWLGVLFVFCFAAFIMGLIYLAIKLIDE